jgi:hypothetical protein
MMNEPIDIETTVQKPEWKKWAASVIILPISIYFIFNYGHYGLIDNADLIIHEGGHGVFRIFGSFIYTAGGTLMQIIIPSLIAWYFLENEYRTGVQFALLWLGQNFINISVYASDARAQKLPLLGGDKVYHDWHWMLSRLDMLEYDHVIGGIFIGIAVIIFIVSVSMPLIMKD